MDPAAASAAKLIAFLKRTDCSAARKNVDALSKRLRGSRLALLSACAFVALAAVGATHEHKDLLAQQAVRQEVFDTAESDAKVAEDAESQEFDHYSTRQVDQASAETDLTVTEAHLERIAAQGERAHQAADEERAALQAQRRAANEVVDRYALEQTKAQEAVRQAQTRIDDDKQQDKAHRPAIDTREAEPTDEMKQALTSAERGLTDATVALVRAQKKRDGISVAAPAASGKSSETDLDAAKKDHSDKKEALGKARLDVAQAQADWGHAQRKLDHERARMTEARKALDDVTTKLKDPQSIRLPILSISLQPPLFYAVAPILLALVYVDGVTVARALMVAISWLQKRAKQDGMDKTDLAVLIPALRDDVASGLLAVAAFAALAGVLVLLTWLTAHAAEWGGAATDSQVCALRGAMALALATCVLHVRGWLRLRRDPYP